MNLSVTKRFLYGSAAIFLFLVSLPVLAAAGAKIKIDDTKYILRIYVSDKKLSYIFSFYGFRFEIINVKKNHIELVKVTPLIT